MDLNRNIIMTGSAGCTSCSIVRLFVNKYPDYRIINLNKSTYAGYIGRLTNLKNIEDKSNSVSVKADTCQLEGGIEKTVQRYAGNQVWMNHVTSGNYQKYYESRYKNR